MSESAQGCNVSVDVSGLDSCRHMPQQLGGACLPPSPSRASWFLPALAALNSSTCDFLWFSPRHLEEEQFSCLGQGLATHTLT